VARQAVEGTIAAARTVGGDAGRLATEAATGAIEGADRIGAAAGRAVRGAVSGTIAGVRTGVEAMTGSGSPRARRVLRPAKAARALKSARRRQRPPGRRPAS
jgi:hypothetical protein